MRTADVDWRQGGRRGPGRPAVGPASRLGRAGSGPPAQPDASAAGGVGPEPSRLRASRVGRPRRRLRLYSASVGFTSGAGSIMIFYAAMATSRRQFALRMVDRLGPVAAGFAVVVEGVDEQDPLVAALVAPATASFLRRAAADSEEPGFAGVEVHHLQRLGG